MPALLAPGGARFLEKSDDAGNNLPGRVPAQFGHSAETSSCGLFRSPKLCEKLGAVADLRETSKAPEHAVARVAPHVFGVFVVFTIDKPISVWIPIEEGSATDLGRASLSPLGIDDELLSRSHARLGVKGGVWTLEDLGSRNGTVMNGAEISRRTSFTDEPVIRLGHTLLLPQRRSASDRIEIQHGATGIVGPTLHRSWQQIEGAARAGSTLLITGETGVGKELAAQVFHQRGPNARGPLVAVNCAAVPDSLAERLFFGVKRGAYSGADADADGYLQAAHGGTLFLDEISELSKLVQAKLLRAIETRTVTALGDSKARPADYQLCSATHNLRKAVALGGFRDDLFFRLGRPEVLVPPLRRRREEIPHLVDFALRRQKSEMAANTAFIESCLLRSWPGNVRELLSEVRRAAGDSLVSGQPMALDPLAGVSGDDDAPPKSRTAGPPVAAVTAEAIRKALKETEGNVTRAAEALGLHRTQLRRLLGRYAIASTKPDA